MRIIGGRFAGRKLIAPSSDKIRPTADRVRESLFNMISHRRQGQWGGVRVLDLFSGTGALGLEALSRGAESVVFVELCAESRGVIRKNIEQLSVEGIAKILRRDATMLGEVGTFKPFDLVFADPPYNKSLGEAAFLAAARGGWLKPGALMVLEEHKTAMIAFLSDFYLREERSYGNSIIRIYEYNLT